MMTDPDDNFLTLFVGSSSWQESFADSRHGHDKMVTQCIFHKKITYTNSDSCIRECKSEKKCIEDP